MNSDDDLRYIDENSCVENRNILIGEDGSNGTITNMKGADALTVPENYPNYIGSCYDSDSRCAYWFGYDVNTTHCSLFRYDVDSGTTTRIIEDTGGYFGIDEDYKMKDVKYFNGQIYFNTRSSEPKVIDINMALYYTTYSAWSDVTVYTSGNKVRFYGGVFNCLSTTSAGQSPYTTPAKWERLYDCYDNSDGQFSYAFNVLRCRPLYYPTFLYGSDTTKKYNNLRGRIFRLASRFIYYDDTRSVYSAISNVTLPTDDEGYNGEISGSVTTNNKLTISVNLGSAALVKYVEVVFQEAEGDWYRITTIDRKDLLYITSETTSIDFYNDASYEAVDNNEINVVYDSVPRTANCQEIINKNTLLYAHCKEGFGNLDKNDIDVTLTPVKKEITVPPVIGTILRDNVANAITDMDTDVSGSPPVVVYWTIIKVASYTSWSLSAGNYYATTVNGYSDSVVLSIGDLATATALATKMKEGVGAPSIWTKVAGASNDELWIGSRADYPDVTVSHFYTAGAASSTFTKHGDFKSGANHPFCIFYYDNALRRGDAQVSDDTKVYVPTLSELSIDTLNYYQEVSWSVAHTPPSWAAYWKWGYAGNLLCNYFIQYVCNGINIADTDFDGMATIDISALQELKNTAKTGTITTIANYGGTVTGTILITSVAHGLSTGDRITISGTSSYNSTYTIIKVDVDTFYVKATWVSSQTGDWVLESWNRLPNSIIDPYTWEQGDRVRIITKRLLATFTSVSDYSGTVAGTIRITTPEPHTLETGDVITISSTTYSGSYTVTKIDSTKFYVTKTYSVSEMGYFYITSGMVLDSLYDYEIVGQDSATNKIILQAGTYTFNAGDCSLIEIYRPIKRGEKLVYYEFGTMMPISGGYHMGETQNQTVSLPATGTFTYGDVYSIMRTPSKMINPTKTTGTFMESAWYSDFYSSDYWSNGKVGIESNIGEQTLNIIRYSNVYIQNTRVNGLSTFEALNYKELNDIYGDIQRIIENGDTLKVYQTKKSASVLIGRTEYTDTSGNTTVATSNNILGSVNYSFTKYGTANPESVVKNNRFIYGFDIYNGVVWRDTANGIFPISGRFEAVEGAGDYKMESYFKAKAKALLVSGLDHTTVHSVWDEEYKMLYVIFSDITTIANNAAIAFHEPSNRWISLYDFTCYDGYIYSTAVWVQSLDMGWLMFGKNASGDSVWKMNSNTASNRCKFFGTKQNCVVGIVANKNGGVMKTLDSMSIHSTGRWSVTATIPANLNYPYGMYSIIPDAKFINREGKLMSEFMRNGLTTGSSPSLLDYINGETMRGYAADIRLTNTDTSKVSMFMVDVNMTKSDV